MYIMILSIMYYFTNFGDLCDSGSFHLYGFPGSTTHYDKKFILLLLTSFISEIKLFLFLFLFLSICAKLESFCPVKHYLHIINIHVLHCDRVYSHVSDINIYSDI